MLRKAIPLIAALVIPFGAAEAGTRQQAQVIYSDDPGLRKVQDQWGFADAVVAGDTIYLSGVVAGVRPGEPTSSSHTIGRFGQSGVRLPGLERAGMMSSTSPASIPT